MKKIEKLPKLVGEGKMSPDKAALEIMEAVYKNRSYFGLKKLQEDQLHDFMLFYYEKSKTVFQLYKSGLGSFTSFLYRHVGNALLSWTRDTQQKAYEEQSLNPLQDMVYEESAYTYGSMEPPEVCGITKDEIPPIKKILEFSEKQEISYSFMRGRKFKAEELQLKKTRILRKEACLVLLLKSCAFINDSMIEKTAAICGKTFDEIKRLVEEAKKTIKSKKHRIRKLEKARDNFFYFKRRYSAEMENTDTGSESSLIISSKIKRAEDGWKTKNEQLHSENLRMPSNVSIGKLLGISDRHVRYVIRAASKNMDNISLKSYYGIYENLLGKRKSEQKAGNVRAFPGTYDSNPEGRGNSV
ncbi:MAG: hypothetical protein II114_05320 [Treponema sp.]|nr:hypothetical protein [Treponema sp.]MBQ4236516.1 hypothetical protein [Treponema sp.]MBQ5382853.1 hypothetical protein [Treponema sp.]